MAVEKPFRATPILGPGIQDVINDPTHYDVLSVTSPSYPVGTRVTGTDGAIYVFVQASADIASTATTGTQVALTYPENTVATGSGGYWTKPGTDVKDGEFIHVRKGAWNAVPA